MKIIKLIILLMVMTFSHDINSITTFNIYSYTICTEDVVQTNNVNKVGKVSKKRKLKNLSLTNKQIDNVLKYQKTITKISKEYKVPVSTIVGIWYAEKSFLVGGTPFGIKCYQKTKSKIYHYDDCGSKKCCFEDYNNFEEAVKFFCEFINNQRDYRNHFDYSNNYTNFSKIANSGYCTSKKEWIANAKKGVNYYNKITNLVNDKEENSIVAETN